MESITHGVFGSWVGSLLVFMVLADFVWRLVERMRGNWEPRSNPPLHKVYVAREEHAQLCARVNDLDSAMRDGFERDKELILACQKDFGERLDKKIAELATAGSQSRAGIYVSIRAIEQSVARIATLTETHSATLGNVDRKIGNLQKEMYEQRGK